MVLLHLRSLSPKQGLCNSTRVVLNKATNILLFSMIAAGDYARVEVLIPIIEITHQNEKFIEWNRRQFSISPAFAMTINNGVTYKKCGSLARGADIHSWAVLYHGLMDRRP